MSHFFSSPQKKIKGIMIISESVLDFLKNSESEGAYHYHSLLLDKNTIQYESKKMSRSSAEYGAVTHEEAVGRDGTKRP